MVISPEQPRRGRGRPRTPGAEKRILEAALEEYGERGWSGFTMDAVARRAGVGKSTVYLRWRDKDSLLTDAVGMRSGAIGDAVETGSLRGDLVALAVNLFEYYLDPAGWASLRITIDKAGAHTPLGQFAEAVAGVQVEFVERILRRGADRGEIGEVSANAVTECIYGAVTMQTLSLLLERRTLDDDEIRTRAEDLVTLVLQGALHVSRHG